jgi:hypothetical protein
VALNVHSLWTGLTYERSAIMKWVDAQKHDPCTKAPLRRRHLSPNLALRAVIENWVVAECGKRCVFRNSAQHCNSVAQCGST